MSRSKWKGPLINTEKNKIFKNKFNLILLNKNFKLTPNYLNKTIDIYNGKNFITLIIDEKMIGNNLGEFVFTRKKFSFTKKKSKK